MTDVPYTHGHHDSVLRSHRWRTAENSAGYLLSHLRPGMTLLDVGCGPGTITCDLARLVAPGQVIGVDASAEVVQEAKSVGTDIPTLSFQQGDLFNLDFDDGTFDVVHAHQVLQHVGDPVAALGEMRRVCRPGGIVAARDGDYPAMTYFPEDPQMIRAFEAYGSLPGGTGPTGMQAGSSCTGPWVSDSRSGPLRIDLVFRHPRRAGLVGRSVG